MRRENGSEREGGEEEGREEEIERKKETAEGQGPPDVILELAVQERGTTAFLHVREIPSNRCYGSRVSGLEVGFMGEGHGIWGLEFRVQGLGSRRYG